MLKESGVKWATVSKGIAGYGEDHKLLHQKMFSVSVNEPILIECLTPESQLNDVIEKINGIISEGTICTIPVQVHIDK
jgi:PII-like signaling protein